MVKKMKEIRGRHLERHTRDNREEQQAKHIAA